MFCSYCGKEINEKMKFCASCGKEVQTMKKTEKAVSSNKKKTPIIVVIILLVVAAVIGGIWYISNLDNDTDSRQEKSSSKKSRVEKEEDDEEDDDYNKSSHLSGVEDTREEKMKEETEISGYFGFYTLKEVEHNFSVEPPTTLNFWKDGIIPNAESINTAGIYVNNWTVELSLLNTDGKQYVSSNEYAKCPNAFRFYVIGNIMHLEVKSDNGWVEWAIYDYEE